MSQGQILIVEDEEIIRASLRRLLERQGYTISDVESVQEAQALFQLKDFALIISDLRVARQTGNRVDHPGGRHPCTDHDQLRQPELSRLHHETGGGGLYRQTV